MNGKEINSFNLSVKKYTALEASQLNDTVVTEFKIENEKRRIEKLLVFFGRLEKAPSI